MNYLLFDIDGTLWDSVPQVCASWNKVLSRRPEADGKQLTVRDVTAMMGHTNEEIAEMMLPDKPKALREEIFTEAMIQEFKDLETEGGTFYPGTSEVLKQLSDAGYALGIVSNCGNGYIEVMLSHAAFAGLIGDFECSGRTGKPKADNIRLVLERNGCTEEEYRNAVYVGDTAMDEAASRGAGVRFIYASYGFGTVKSPDAVIRSIAELPDALRKLGKEAQ